MNELIREIEEDIRRERIQKLWHNFGRLMVTVSIAVLLVTVGYVVWQERAQSRAMAATSRFMKGLDRMRIEDYAGAIAVFNGLAADERSNYYPLALLRKAEAELALGEKDAARKTYEQLTRHPSAFGDLAKMLAAADGTVPPEPAKNAPFYYAESERRAWALLSSGKKEEAVKIFAALEADAGAPASMRTRLSEALRGLR